MKTGKSLTELATLIENQRATRKDFVAAQGAIETKVVDGVIVADGFNGAAYGLNNHAHGQLADHLGIPKKYYDRMLVEQPALLTDNINAWLHAQPKERRLVRVLEGKVRGILSPKYRPLDNYDLLEAVLPTLLEHKVQVISMDVTETRFYLKGILPELSDPLPEGLVYGAGHTDITKYAPGFVIPADQQFFGGERRGRLVAAITISNSEVGAGALRIDPSVFLTWCTNLAVLAQAAMKKYHVGRAWESTESLEAFTDETRKADDKAFFMKVRDITVAAFDGTTFKKAVEDIKATGERTIESPNLQKVVDTAVRQLALPVGTSSGILNFLTRGGDLSQWGLANAVTMAANVAESYESATELEYAGGKVLALDNAGWEAIAKG